MKILAIDPGPHESAWCELESGVPCGADKQTNDEVLKLLRHSATQNFSLIAIEMIASMGMPVGKEIFETVRWIGRFQEACETQGKAVRLVYRKEVKLFLCESNRANDSNIRAAILDRYGGSRTVAIGTTKKNGPLFGLKGDMWSALAVALTAEASIESKPLFAPAPPVEKPDLLATPF